jgi:tRNA(fMet)-specific endonuclease VapC
LIDLQNERRGRGRVLGAGAFLRHHLKAELYLPAVARGEYLEGFDDPAAVGALEWVGTLKVLDVTAGVARIYAAAARHLRAAGKLIGANDLWIASTAMASGLPLVTRNAVEFRRVPGLEVLAYQAE